MKAVIFCLLLSISGSFQTDCTVTDFANVQSAIESCTQIVLSDLVVPAGQTLNLMLQDGTKVMFRGRTTFEYKEWSGPLVAINGTNVEIYGDTDAILDGQGQLYWDGKGEWSTKIKPIFFVMQLHSSIMRDIYVFNAPIHCTLLTDSTDVQMYNWFIDNQAGNPDYAGSDKAGHNTDGFDIWNGTNIVLTNATVYNQDDCVAIRCGNNILVEQMNCYDGHGLSISVGFSNDSVELNTLRNVIIRDSFLRAGQNAIHIKTHVDGGQGLIQNVTYENIEFVLPLNYGIRIHQNYRNLPGNSTNEPVDPKDNIPIKDLKLISILGTTGGIAVPLSIVCAEGACTGWSFQDLFMDGDQPNDCTNVPDGVYC